MVLLSLSIYTIGPASHLASFRPTDLKTVSPSHVSHSLTLFTVLTLLTSSILALTITTPTPPLLPRSAPASTVASPPSTTRAAFCTDSDAWVTSSYAQDCNQAFDRFRYTDVLRYGNTPFQFHDRNTQPIDKPPGRLSPRRYTIGRCTVAIVLLHQFPREFFPEPRPAVPRAGWAKRDVANYSELWNVLGLVGLGCVRTAKPAGWAQGGEIGGLGVFVWATNSDVDRAVEGYMPRHGALAGNETDWKQSAIDERVGGGTAVT